jgi:hypothetical protein
VNTRTPPPGERIPHPDRWHTIGRSATVLWWSLTLARPWILERSFPDAASTPLPSLVDVGMVLTALQHSLARQAVGDTLAIGSWLLLAASCSELLLRGIRLYRRRRYERRAVREYLRITLPPFSTATAITSGALARCHAVLQQPGWSLVYGATHAGRVQLGWTVPQHAANAAAPMMAALLSGIIPGIVLRRDADPLERALTVGRRVMHRTYRCAEADAFPLAIAVTPSAALFAALQPPPGVAWLEVTLGLHAVATTRQRLSRGWTGRVMALRQRLRQRAMHHLTPEAALLERRLAAPTYAVTLTVTAVSEPGADAAVSIALDAIAAAIATLEQPTADRVQRLCVAGARHTVVRRDQRSAVLRHARRLAWPPVPCLLIPRLLPANSMIISSAELATLFELPLGHAEPFVERRANRWLPASDRAIRPHPGRITIGLAEQSSGQSLPVGPTLRDLRQILHITAGMGAGKTRLLANLCQQCLPYGFTLIDGKGDDRDGSLVATVQRLIPHDDEARLVIIDPLDTDWPVPLNPLLGHDCGHPAARDMLLGHVLALFARLDPDTWNQAVGMQQLARMATLLLLDGEPAPTLGHLRAALIDDDYREHLLARCTTSVVHEFWKTVFPRLSDGQRASREALLRRIDMLLSADATRLMLAPAPRPFQFHRAIADGWIVLVPLPDLALGTLAGAIGMLLLQGFVQSAFARAGTDQDRHDYPLIIDELQVTIAGSDAADLNTAITRLRSFGIPGIYAHQTLSQLGDLADVMLVNAANRVIMQTNEPDASRYAHMYASYGIEARDIMMQNANQHQYAIFRNDGHSVGLLSLTPLIWPDGVTCGHQMTNVDDAYSWQSVLPEDRLPIDCSILSLVYTTKVENIDVMCYVSMDESLWSHYCARWEYIRQYQWSYIMKHPTCIPDQRIRQRWLSRLLIARPRVFAMIAELRLMKYRNF